MRYIGLAVLAIQAVAQPEIVVDGVWCSNGEDNFIQWESELEATALEKDQFCIMLKATKTGRGVIVGKGVSRYKKSSYTPHRAASLLKHDVFYDATVFSFASHQLNFNSKKEALNTILDYRNEYKKNFHIVSFKSYTEILKNITRALLSQALPAGVLKLTSVNDPIYGDTKLLEWSGYQHVQLFLEEINNYY